MKKPIWNGKVERFNRTMQEEWLANPDVQILLKEDRDEAKKELQKYVDWYNDERPHQSGWISMSVGKGVVVFGYLRFNSEN